MNQPEYSTFGQTIQATFDRLEGCLEQAQQIVPVNSVEQLIELLPKASRDSQRFILSELIKLDMASAADLGQIRLLDFYLAGAQIWLNEQDLPLDLVLEELQVRRDNGQSPTLEEYQGRFPRWAGVLSDLPWDRLTTGRASQQSGLPVLEGGQYIEDFRILHALGRGAFAQVYLAIQESMNRLVALKVSSRGTDEPQTLSQLDHPNIVRVYDQRTIHLLQVHLLYMQAVLGGNLASVVSATRDTPLDQLSGELLLGLIDQSLIAAQQQPPEREPDAAPAGQDWATTVAWIGQQLAEGLQSAHDKGVFHRDVKPANILMTAEGRPKLADFNVSHSALTEKGSAIGGTLAYMAPEHLIASDALQVQADPVDARSDLYSLAVVLWELWQGQRPWPNAGPAENWSAAVRQQLALRSADPICRREDRSSAGQWLYRVLRQSLSVSQSLRPQTCRELGMRLRLAMFPDLAARFAPPLGSLVDRLRKHSVLIIAAMITILPNALAGLLNYVYNYLVVIGGLKKRFLAEMTPDLAELAIKKLVTDFERISLQINATAFGIGAMILIYFCWRVRQSLSRANANLPASDQDIDWVWMFGHRAAVIGASLWISFGLIFPVIIRWSQPAFSNSDIAHFFMSLSICGGIAWIYPFYGVSLLSTVVYYPLIISPTMSDANYEKRADWMRGRADFYLASSAVIPLFTLLLIITQPESDVPNFLKLVLVLLTFLAVVFSFKAYQILYRVIDQYGQILGNGQRRQTNGQ
ncbi:MAG: serine/threonine-protein kinase [Pirellulales bacterium]